MPRWGHSLSALYLSMEFALRFRCELELDCYQVEGLRMAACLARALDATVYTLFPCEHTFGDTTENTTLVIGG